MGTTSTSSQPPLRAPAPSTETTLLELIAKSKEKISLLFGEFNSLLTQWIEIVASVESSAMMSDRGF
ncbi:hypothetical protein M5689_025085 [Euphorbia peplus]|nr:hypothetical protein M5689_025085 [Euphorbia peplus]